MFRINLKFLPSIILSFLLFNIIFSQTLFNDRDEGKKAYQRYKNRPKASLKKVTGKADRGVGILDRGEISNVTGNFGVLSNFHLFAPAMHWPSWVDDTHQYCFGLELLVGINGDVVTSIHDPATVAENFDWEAKDGSFGNLFSGNITASDGTPILASSDNRETWPIDNNEEPFWPGPFRFDPASDQEIEGEFISERDIYAEFTDQNNINSPYGLHVNQRTFSFSRSYARDFIIFDFQLFNTSLDTLDSVWVGYMADFKVDFDTHDHIRFTSIKKDNPDDKDLIYLWDADPSEGIWDITGYIGFLSLFTPEDKGITDLHYFDNIYEPSTNEQIWEIMTSDTSGTHITRRIYFHGDNYRIDDDALADDMDPSGNKLGTDFVFIISTGPVSIPAGESVHSAFAVVMGESIDQLQVNAEMVRNMANQYYLGPNAPRSPQVQGFSGDKQVTVTWDGKWSETSRDLLSGKIDFEGYRVYRSEDFGQNWGRIITDELGNIIGYVPIAQYDLDNEISGKDPNSNFYLGSNTGIKHTFIDSTAINGVEYWYSVTSYDRGDVATGLPALESSLGVTPDEANVVRVIPARPSSGLQPSEIQEGDSLAPIGGHCDSRVAIQIMDQSQLTDHNYRITFNDAGFVINPNEDGILDTTITTTFNLIDLSTQDTLLNNHPILNETGDNVPTIHGFRVLTYETTPGVTYMGWTLVNGDTCNFDWHREVRGNETGAPWINGWDDFRITVDLDGPGIPVMVDDQFGDVWGPEIIPLEKVEVITDPENPIEVTQNTWLIDYAFHGLTLPEPEAWFQFFGPLGWDLVPGGKGYNGNVEKWPDALSFRIYYVNDEGDTIRVNGVDIRTQNRPNLKPPTDGDQYTILTKKLFRSDIYFEFKTSPPAFQKAAVELDKIKVVPNPYIVRAGWERSEFEGRIQFTNLPRECDISIYTASGDHIINLHHSSFVDYEFWNLQNENGVLVAYGLYVYVIKTPDGEKHTGKFVIIR